MKTLLKLYPNGDFETVDTALVQSETEGNYAFAENSITVPKIIEYPAATNRNYFVEKYSYPGWTLGTDVNPPGGNHDRVSDFIGINEFGQITVRLIHKNIGSLVPEFRVFFYDSNKKYISGTNNSYFEHTYVDGELMYYKSFDIDNSEKYMRFSINHYDNPNVSIMVSVNKGFTSNTKHYLAFEDMPDWVVDTGNPISIFPQGIVIKGDLIQSQS